ncbi:MAG: hypothetical protein M3Y72_00660 [Acidobacteriota bacterium]|nr:hypothetical protein [Acidobacteriota bacterium]
MPTKETEQESWALQLTRADVIFDASTRAVASCDGVDATSDGIVQPMMAATSNGTWSGKCSTAACRTIAWVAIVPSELG